MVKLRTISILVVIFIFFHLIRNANKKPPDGVAEVAGEVVGSWTGSGSA